MVRSGSLCETGCGAAAHFGLPGDGKRRWCGSCAKGDQGDAAAAYLAGGLCCPIRFVSSTISKAPI